MEGRAGRFRESVRDQNAGRNQRRRFTESQQREALTYFDSRRSAGATIAEVATELGIGKTTLERWRRRRSSFVRVEAVGADSTPLCVVSPSGYRIEGLSLDQAAELLSRLG